MILLECFRQVASIFAALLLLSDIATPQTGPCATVIPGNPLPDLIVNQSRLASDIHVTDEKFSSYDCAVVNGCVTSKGTHQLLRFTSAIPNVGGGDLVIGDPSQCTNLFQLNPCYGFYDFTDSAAYRLWTDAGYQNWVANRDMTQPANRGINATLLQAALNNGDLIVGRKQQYCFNDDDQYDPNANPTPIYTTCGSSTSTGNQGLQVGWEDTYSWQIPCQYIQIDKLPGAIYVLEVQVNPDQVLPESDYTNNSSAVRFQFIPQHGRTPAQIILL